MAPLLHPSLRWVAFGLTLSVGLSLDLLSKRWAFAALPEPGDTRVVVEGWFALTHAENTGAAFGLGRGWSWFVPLTRVMAMGALLALTFGVHTTPRTRRGVAAAGVLGAILAGVLGNFWDRIVFDSVRDFLDWHTPPTGTLHDLCARWLGSTVWPTSNVADVLIDTGVLALILGGGLGAGRARERPLPEEAPSRLMGPCSSPGGPAG